MSDPRVERTRIHIREVVLAMMARGDDLTISSVAKEGLVSRRTIYAHWGTIEDLVADSIFLPDEAVEREEFLTTYKNPLRLLPTLVREVVAYRARPLAV